MHEFHLMKLRLELSLIRALARPLRLTATGDVAIVLRYLHRV